MHSIGSVGNASTGCSSYSWPVGGTEIHREEETVETAPCLTSKYKRVSGEKMLSRVVSKLRPLQHSTHVGTTLHPDDFVKVVKCELDFTCGATAVSERAKGVNTAGD